MTRQALTPALSQREGEFVPRASNAAVAALLCMTEAIAFRRTSGTITPPISARGRSALPQVSGFASRRVGPRLTQEPISDDASQRFCLFMVDYNLLNSLGDID